MKEPKSIADLKAADYNPRAVSDEALEGLKVSLGEFGDLSGIVYCSRSGHLVAGHQRIRALKEQHGDALKLEGGDVVTPDGKRFPVRIVDWGEAREKAANVAANNPHIAGDFTADLGAVIADITLELPDLAEALRLPELTFVMPSDIPDDNQDINEDDLANTANECPKCGFKW